MLYDGPVQQHKPFIPRYDGPVLPENARTPVYYNLECTFRIMEH